jgi:Domain of unknown function (DUF4404)
MDPNALREQLTQLHEELRNADKVDPQVQQLLGEIMRDIARLDKGPAAAAPSSDPSLPDRLEKIAVQFEADHPALAASTRRFVDLLGKAGI